MADDESTPPELAVKRKKFATASERKRHTATRKKLYDQSRINIGNHWKRWEEQREVDGYKTQVDWIGHLLALHEARCQFHQVMQVPAATGGEPRPGPDVEPDLSMFVEGPEQSPPIFVPDIPDVYPGSEVIPETPLTKRKRKMPLEGLDSTKSSPKPSTSFASEDSEVLPDFNVPIPMTASTPLQPTKLPMRPRSEPEVEHSPVDVEFEDESWEKQQKDVQLVPEEEMGMIEYYEEIDDDTFNDEEIINVTFPDEEWQSLLVSDDGDDDDDKDDSEESSDEDPDKTWQPPDAAQEEPIPNGRLTEDVPRDIAIMDQKCIAHKGVLESLVQRAVGQKCRKCGTKLEFNAVMLGSCLVVSWQCEARKSHMYGSWSSQPRTGDMYSSNFLVPVCLILSGNNYKKLALFAKFLNLGFVGETNTYRIQRLYIHPVVVKYWEDMRTQILNDVKEPLVLSGDGRNDSPGHSAQYCTYTLMDCATMKIVSTVNVDVRSADLKSTNMERIGFRKAMRDVMEKAAVKEVVTDEHPQIRATMKHEEEFSGITHQFDLWHKAKNLAKKLAAASKLKGCSAIGPWIPHVVNHFWYCAQHCDGDELHLKEHWTKVMHHVCNRHNWIDTSGITSGQCNHPIPLTEEHSDRPWLEENSVAANAMRKILFDKTFLASLVYVRNFRHTGMLEVFHSHLLMYASKRNTFKFLGYQVRTLLAAIDFNSHASREIAKDKEDKARMIGKYNKQSAKWYVQAKKKPKEYLYIPQLISRIFLQREIGARKKERLDTKAVMLPEDPARERATRAAVPKPSMDDLLRQHKSRFEKQD